ncbi:MAG: MMPL family transporter [Candidatus Hydrogenedentes bacterium]|nr:MMPL family transporter [Candidatus Hydrogenedentota bacterium]
MNSTSPSSVPTFPRVLVAVCAAAIIVLGIAASFATARLRTDNSIEHWLNPSSPATLDYARFRQMFGADEFIVVCISGKPLFDQAALDAMLIAQDALLRVPEVHRVAGIPAVYRDVFGAEDPDALQAEFTSTPFYRGLYISPDATAAGLFLEIVPPEDSPERSAMLSEIEAAAQPLRDHGFRVDLVGPPTLNVALDEISERETRRAIPIALVCSIIMLLVLLRSARAVLVACVCAWLSVVIPLGLIHVSGYTLTMVSSVLPPLLWSLSLAHSVHFITHYYRHRTRGEGVSDAVARAWFEVRLPCALAAITTSAGFLSLAFSSMPPIRHLGVFASIAIVISMVANLAVAPTLTALFQLTPRPQARSRWAPLLLRMERLAEQRTWTIVIVFAAIGIAGAISITQLRPEPNPLSFLPKDATAVQSYNFVSENLTGLYTLETVVDCPNGWLDPAYWPTIDAMTAQLESVEYVARRASPLDLLRKLNQWDNAFDPATYVLPESQEEAARLIHETPAWTRNELQRLVSTDGKTIRLSILVRAMDAERFYALTDFAQGVFDALDDGVTARLTGIVLLLNNAQVELAITQVKSFAFSFLTVFAMIGLGLRSLRLMGLAMAPTVLPTLAAFAVMPLLGIPLDAATVLVAGVALGMADDNTIHLIASYRLLRKPGQPTTQAVSAALIEVGPALIYSTGTSCIGFFTLCASEFVPIRYFGFLSGLALLTALLANLLLTPALILLVNRRRGGPEREAI